MLGAAPATQGVTISWGLEPKILRHMVNALEILRLLICFTDRATFTHKSESNSPWPKIVNEILKEVPFVTLHRPRSR